MKIIIKCKKNKIKVKKKKKFLLPHNMKPLNAGSTLKSKKNPKIQKSNLANFGQKLSKPAIVI